MPTYKSFAELYDGFQEFRQDPPSLNLCNCVGPEPGQTECKCTKRVKEAEKRLIEKPEFKGRSGG